MTTWHKRQVTQHLQQLTAVRDQSGTPEARLAVLLPMKVPAAPRRRNRDQANRGNSSI